MKPHPDAKATALRHIQTKRESLTQSASPISDSFLAESAARYVGVDTATVIKWMAGR